MYKLAIFIMKVIKYYFKKLRTKKQNKEKLAHIPASPKRIT